MVTKYSQTRDINGYNGFGLPPSDLNYSSTLAAATDTTFTVPSTMGMGSNGIYSRSVWLAILTYTPAAEVWVAVNAVAAVPGGAPVAATSSMLNPTALQVNGGDVIHFFNTPGAKNVSIRLYSLS